MALLTPREALHYAQNNYLIAYLDHLMILHLSDDRHYGREFVVYPVMENGVERFHFHTIVKKRGEVYYER